MQKEITLQKNTKSEIPIFPNFKKLEPEDREIIEHATAYYLPYSDFNSTSLCAWDTLGEVKISMLNGNIVIRFTDYLSGEPFYSFLGNKKSNETVEKLLRLCVVEGLSPELRLVPQVSVENLDLKKFTVTEDRDNFDYILDCKKLVELKGSTLRGHASFKRRFIEEYGDDIKIIQLNVSNSEHQEMMKNLNKIWIENKKIENKDKFINNEFKATERFFDLCANRDNFIAVGVLVNNELIAYVVDELLERDIALRHFMKANSQLKGSYSFLVSEAAQVLLNNHRHYLNIEQDLGLKNLRQAKKTFDPVNFLKKCIIKAVDNTDGQQS